jgi:hypothetical protein
MQKPYCFDGRSEHHNYFSYIALTVRMTMQNQDNKNNPRPSLQDGIIERLKGQSRLSPADKKVFVINLGKLAARIDEAKPLNGAKKIVDHLKQEGIWQKRKRFFRLPGEETPDNGSEGEYASNPVVFIALAEAAGELLCNSAKKENIEREKQAAVKTMITGSSYAPKHTPLNAAEISAKALLDEYAEALAEAIQSRTKITDLWTILETTNITVEGFTQDETVGKEPSIYGQAANFPNRLFDGIFRKPPQRDKPWPSVSQFTTGYDYRDWAYPRVRLGYLATTHQIRMFSIPEDQRSLCQNSYTADLTIASSLLTLGFDLNSCDRLPDYDFDEHVKGAGWKQVTASIMHEIYIGIRRNHSGNVKIVLSISPLLSQQSYYPDVYLIDERGIATRTVDPGLSYFDLAKKEKQLIDSRFQLSQNRNHGVRNSSHNIEFVEDSEDDYDGSYTFDFVYNELVDHKKNSAEPLFNKKLPIGILPNGWIELEQQNWLNDGHDFYEFEETIGANGWTEDRFLARVLLGAEDLRFYPVNPEAKPIAGVLRKGSVGASLLNNLNAKSDANSITNLLIEKAALTAEAGLKFYEAMLEDHRSAIRKI